MKKTISIFLVFLLLLCLFPTNVFASTVSKELILGSWYGQYTGSSNDEHVERYMNMTITDCDDSGNISGVAYITTVENQGYDHQWINYYFKGNINFSNNTFLMQGVEKISSDTTGNWIFASFVGTLNYNSNSEIYVSGLVENDPNKLFYFGHVSDWAKSEITEANMYGLIPETMKTKDLSKPITRAEFAAVSNQLYETLTNTKTPILQSTFTDIYGNVDEDSIKKAHFLNITVGYSDTIFAPNEFISREQLATMLCRAIKKYKYPDWSFEKDSQYILDYSGVPPYADDYLIADYAKPSVYYMTKSGIINGFENNLFAPKNITDEQIASGYATATREQAITTALRIYKIANSL